VDFYLGQADIHRVTGASRVKFLAWAGGSLVRRGARLSSRAAVASLRVGLPPDARCGIHDDVVDTLGLVKHRHMA